MKKRICRIFCVCLLLLMLCGCTADTAAVQSAYTQGADRLAGVESAVEAEQEKAQQVQSTLQSMIQTETEKALERQENRTKRENRITGTDNPAD